MIVAPNFFDVLRRAAGDGPRIHRAARRSAGARPGGGGHQPRFWARRLGRDPSVLGKPLVINGQAVHGARCPAGGAPSVPRVMASRRKSTCRVSPALMPGLRRASRGPCNWSGGCTTVRRSVRARAALATARAASRHQFTDKKFADLQQFAPVGGWSRSNDIGGIAAFFGVLLVAVGARAGGRLRQRRRAPAVAQHGAPPRDRHSCRDRRQPRASDPAAPERRRSGSRSSGPSAGSA